MDICARNQTECKKYASVEKKIKDKLLRKFIMATNARLEYDKQIFLRVFNSFRNKIKNCTTARYKWQPNDVCIRERRKCFHQKLNATSSKVNNKNKFQHTNCPCPVNRAYVCGSERNYCSLS